MRDADLTIDPKRDDALEAENAGLRRAVAELSLLNDLSREIGASLDAEKIMERIVKRSLQAVTAEQGVIALLKDDETSGGQTLIRINSTSGDHPALHLHDQILGWMYLNRRPLMMNEPASDDRFRGIPWSDEIRSILCAPLLVRSRLIGVLTVYNKKNEGLFREEDQRLLSIIAAQSAQIIENARLYEEERNLIRMREELRVAERIQTGLLPGKPPKVDGYELAGMSIPAQSVGGDYFDYLTVDSTHVAVCVADVSGKGLPASLLMSNVQAALRSRVSAGESPADCLAAVNGLLRRSMNRGSFVTMVYGILDAESHHFTFANAGHNRPLLKRSDGSVEKLKTAGLALGLVTDPVFPLDTVQLDPGDELLLYSDGITEAMNTSGEEWGEERLRSFLSGHKATVADELLKELTATVGLHRASAPQQDDMTLVFVRRR